MDNYTYNGHLIISDTSSPVKKIQETGASLPVKELFDGIYKEALVKFSPAISYQEIGYVKYNLEFCGSNAGKLENRRKPTALKTAFKFWAMTSQALNPIEILLVDKNKNITVKIQKYKIQ